MIHSLILGCMAVLLLACVVMTFSRSMALSRFGVLELVMAAAIGGSAVLGCRTHSRFRTRQSRS